jgi:ureidoacrylate peracid hydrolase
MFEIAGKQIPTTLREMIDPKHVALILVDIQNDYCMPGGKYACEGKDMSMYSTMIERVAALITAARQNRVLVIYVQNTNLNDYRSDSVACLRYKLNIRAVSPEDLWRSEHALEGTWGHQIVDAIAPQADDLVVKKHRSSAFVNTRLDLLLRSNNVRTVLVTGVVTEGCVQSTALHASFKDYLVILVEDCIGSCSPRLHAAALDVMRTKFDVAPSHRIIRGWSTFLVDRGQDDRPGGGL